MTTSSKAASGGGNGDIKRIANQLLDASKQAKDRLTQQQEGYLAWLCEELMRVKGRFMQPPSSIPAPQETEPAAKAPATRGGKRKAETPEPAPTSDSDEGAKLVPKDLRVVDLRRELRARGLATSGVKAVLVARLEEALAEEEFEGEKENALPQIEEANEDQEENDAVEEATQGGKKSKSAAGAPKEEEEEAPAKPQRSTGRRQKSAEEPEAAVPMEVEVAEAPAASEEVVEPAPMEVDKPQSPVKGKSSKSKSKSKSKSQPEAVKAEVAEPSPAKAPSPLEGVAAAAPEKVSETTTSEAKSSLPSSNASTTTSRRSSGRHKAASASPIPVAPVEKEEPEEEAAAPPTQPEAPARRASRSSSRASLDPAPKAEPPTKTPCEDKPKKRSSVEKPSKPITPAALKSAGKAQPAPSSTSAPAPVAMSYLDRIALLNKPTGMPSTKPTTSRRSSIHKPAALPTTAMPAKPSRRLSQIRAPGQALPSSSSLASKPAAQPSTTAPAALPMGGAMRVANDAKPTASTSAAASGGQLPKPSNLLSGLHSLTSLVSTKPAAAEATHANSHKVEVPALKKAQEARRLEQAKAEERQRLKEMREQQMEQRRQAAVESKNRKMMAIDASRLEQEANKKRAELAAKRKEREEKFRQPGTTTQPSTTSAASSALSAPKPSTAEVLKKPRIEGQIAAPTSISRPAPTPAAPTSSKPEAAPSTTAPSSSALKPPPLKDIPANAPPAPSAAPASSSFGFKKLGEALKNPFQAVVAGSSAAMSKVAAGTGLASAAAPAPQDEESNYPISDRDESSDDDYESDDRAKDDKVPEWAKGDALRKAIHRQFHGEKRLDPDTIFADIGDCDLDEVFQGCAEEGKKQRSYRTRQSTGNWLNDQLSTVEKVRYRRAMGWR